MGHFLSVFFHKACSCLGVVHKLFIVWQIAPVRGFKVVFGVGIFCIFLAGK